MANQSLSSLTSFSGSDLVCTFADQAIAELQAITWAINSKDLSIF